MKIWISEQYNTAGGTSIVTSDYEVQSSYPIKMSRIKWYWQRFIQWQCDKIFTKLSKTLNDARIAFVSQNSTENDSAK